MHVTKVTTNQSKSILTKAQGLSNFQSNFAMNIELHV